LDIRKIVNRIDLLIRGQDEFGNRIGESLKLDANTIALEVCQHVKDGIKSTELDEITAEICAYKLLDPEYNELAKRLVVSNNHKNSKNFVGLSEMTELLNRNGNFSDEYVKLVGEYGDRLDRAIDFIGDYLHMDFFGFKTLEKNYLLKATDADRHRVVERPQHLWMRVALEIHRDDTDRVIETYRQLSNFRYVHATPTLFNAGHRQNQLSSCFVKGTEVCTTDGPKNIEDVVIGDEVVTHTGDVNRVAQVHVNPLGERKIYRLKCHATPEIFVTGDHRIMATRHSSASWVPVEQLTTDHYVEIPKRNAGIDEHKIDIATLLPHLKYRPNVEVEYECDDESITPFTVFDGIRNRGNRIGRYLVINEEAALVLGALYGHGSSASIGGCDACNGSINVQANEALVGILLECDRFARMTKVNPAIHVRGGRVHLTINSCVLGSVFEHLTLHPMMFKWSEKLVKSFMIGLISAIGRTTESGHIGLPNLGQCKRIFHLCRQIGVPISVDKGEVVLPKGWIRARELRFRDGVAAPDDGTIDETHFTVYRHDRAFVKVERVEATDRRDECVYTLGVENDHSYNVEGTTVQNCFLAGVPDSIEGMYETVRRMAHISKNAGGIGLHLHDIRGNNAVINSTGGKGSGTTPYIRCLNDVSKHVDQGGKRKGSMALYMEPWHPDIFEFLELRKNTGNEELRARDVFPALFIPDLFMKRVREAVRNGSKCDGPKCNGPPPSVVYWSLMCPKRCPGLSDCYGEEFDELYARYEREGLCIRRVDILSLWNAILDSQMETSLPYMVYKDAVNSKSNQMNVGVIKSSNLCTEIMEYSSYDEYACCNLASICLPKFVDLASGPDAHGYDLMALADVAGQLARNLNRIIDQGYSPLPQVKKSNLRHRPIGIGVQGLADVFFKLRYPFESARARQLNSLISEAIYYGAVRESVRLSRERGEVMSGLKSLSDEERDRLVSTVAMLEMRENCLHDHQRRFIRNPGKAENDWQAGLIQEISTGKAFVKDLLRKADIAEGSMGNLYELQYWDHTQPVERWGSYSTFEGSPASKGLFQFDLWNREPSAYFADRWASLRGEMVKYGMRNSLLVAYMPTASTAQIMGNNECFEPITSNFYSRSVLAGNFIVINKYLQRDLIGLGLWNEDMKNRILLARGSVQDLNIPKDMKDIYKTSWEIKKRTYLDMAADRSRFIDQSQSLNLFIEDPTPSILTTVHLYGWELGLKTGMYYLRRKTVTNAQQFTVPSRRGNPSVSSSSSEGVSNSAADKIDECTGDACITCQA